MHSFSSNFILNLNIENKQSQDYGEKDGSD